MTQEKLNFAVSKKVGQYVGPVLSVLFLSELVTLYIYNTPTSAHTVYLNGFVLFSLSFYLITIHNIWTKHWPILITLSAWAMTALGLYRLFFPAAPQAPVDTVTYFVIATLLAVELFVTAKSYSK